VDLLPSSGIALAAPGNRRSALAAAISSAFRALPRPVVGRVKDGAFIMDLRCLEDESAFLAQLPQLDLKNL
jgi:L-seryl-tRNA(Ser) seleniumtransferase